MAPHVVRSRRWPSLIWKLGLGGAAIGLLAWGGYAKFLASNGSEIVDITGTVKRANLPITVTERGELESSSTTDVRCEIEGYQNKLATILPEGTQVKKGDVVVTFDTDQLKKAYDDQQVKWKQADGKAKMAKGELEVQKNKSEGEIAKADLALTLAKIDRDKYLEGEYKVELTKKKGAISLAEKELRETKEKFDAMQKLVKKGFQPPETLRIQEILIANKEYLLDSSKDDLMVLEKFTRKGKEVELSAKADEAERELKRAKASGAAAIEKAQSDLEAADVTAALEKTALDRAKKQLDRTVVKAPQDGILVYSKDRYWDPSARIQPGAMVHYQQNIFSLPDLGKMQVKVKIHEAMVKKIQPGQKAEIRVESQANTVLHGSVIKVETLADSRGYWDERGVKEYVTIVKIDDLVADAGLKPGMTAEVKILVQEISNVLMVPVQAVAQKGKEHFAYAVLAKGVERRAVSVGENNEKFVEIKGGLEEGDKVALDARTRLAAETKGSEENEEQKAATEKTKAAQEKAKAAAPPAPAAPTAAPIKK
jgi:RND family efflux transporter MFP subunit